MARPAPEVMLAAINTKATADLLFLLTDTGVHIDQQYDLVEAGYFNIKLFSGMEDDRTKVRAALVLDLQLDPTAVGAPGKLARLALAALVTAWESARERLGKETAMRTEAKVHGVPRMVDILERTSMKKAVELLYGTIPLHESPSADYLAHKVEQLEDNDSCASPLDEVSSMTDVDLSAQVSGWDAAGRSQLFRKRAKGSLPLDPESFRTRLRIERNLWLYLATKYNNRSWLAGLTPKVFEEYTDYFLGRKVLLLEICQADGVKTPLRPPWQIILSYEFECRRAAFIMVAELGTRLEDALRLVIKDPEMKELAFTSPVAHLGRSSRPVSTGATGAIMASAKKGQHLIDNPNYPLKRAASSQAQPRGKGKGKAKGKGRGKGKGKGLCMATPDGRPICFNYSNQAVGCPEPCANGRLHVCRWTGCFGTHPTFECPA